MAVDDEVAKCDHSKPHELSGRAGGEFWICPDADGGPVAYFSRDCQQCEKRLDGGKIMVALIRQADGVLVGKL